MHLHRHLGLVDRRLEGTLDDVEGDRIQALLITLDTRPFFRRARKLLLPERLKRVGQVD